MNRRVKKHLMLPLMQRCTSVPGLPSRTAFSILFISALPLLVHAEIYSCKDGTGRTITSDRLMAECGDRAVRELSNTGVVKGEIPAPLNAEQKRQLQLQEEKRQAAAAALEQQRQQDRALLSRYRSESDIATSRRYYLGLSQDLIKRDQEWIADAEKQLKATQVETEFYKNKKLPAALRIKIDEANRAIQYGKEKMHEHQVEAAGINAKFDDTLKRYRDLTRSQSTAASR
jgi:hypothetical protein